MLQQISSLTLILVALAAFGVTTPAQSTLTARASATTTSPPASSAESDRLRDGLVGPVRRVRTEVAKLNSESGRLAESKPVVLEVVAYDVKGNKVENQYFPIAGASLTGKEVYKYDDKGNISEMTLLNSDGSLLGKEVYKYEFDFAGNWNKMTTAVAVIEGGKLSFEPTEITYRHIMYYLDENIMKLSQPASPPVVTAASNTASVSPEPKSGSAKLSIDSSAPSGPKTSPVLQVSLKNVEKLTALESAAVEVPHTNAGPQVPVVHLDSEPPPAPRPILKPVSGGVLNGTALILPAPTYPEAARRLRVSGLVSVDVIVDETGKVISASATSGPAVLRDVAIQAALRARFSPTTLSGQPVKVSGSINYRFSLAQ